MLSHEMGKKEALFKRAQQVSHIFKLEETVNMIGINKVEK
jgi:hypothetical protein